jgi:hypothetical protein
VEEEDKVDYDVAGSGRLDEVDEEGTGGRKWEAEAEASA